jgi:GNAT superfamily N-acetyltransferase
MRIAIDNSLPDKVKYFELYSKTGANRDYSMSPGLLHESLRRSWFMISVYNEERLIGFGRVISDGVIYALVVDFMVDPDYQGCGIGRMILRSLVQKCREAGIPDIMLFSPKGKTGYYARNGFRARPHDAPGMEYVQA